jgi:transposase
MDRAQGARIWMASEATDMRCGFDRLAERVKAVIGENPQSGHLFVFRSRRGDRLKILIWDRDGFVLWYKRLEIGVFMKVATEGEVSTSARGGSTLLHFF